MPTAVFCGQGCGKIGSRVTKARMKRMRRRPDRYRFTHSLRTILALPRALAISRELSRQSGSIASVKIFYRPIHRGPIMEVERTAKGFNIYSRRLKRKSFMHRAPSVLALLRRPDCITTRTTVCIGEGLTAKESTRAPMIAFCAGRGHRAILIPDYEFLSSHGYDGLRRWAALNWQEWDSRSETVLWRGATSGSGSISSPEMIHDRLLPRVQLCLVAKNIPGTDMKITNIVQSKSPDLDRDRLAQAGIMGARLPVETWAGHKFAIDIDGNTNSFGTMLQRWILGCCVLKVGGTDGWGQWYYDSVKPWVHFIPVHSDLSDLAEKIAWCRHNDQKCQQIAAEGRAFANSLEYETEKKLAVERINAAYQSSVT